MFGFFLLNSQAIIPYIDFYIMNIKSTLVCVAFILSNILHAQEANTPDNSIDLQLQNLYKTSSSYQEYKVIKKTRYRELQSNVLDSIAYFKDEITRKNALIKTHATSIDSISKINEATDIQLNEAISQIDTIRFFGAELKKSRYSFVLFMIIFVLAILLIVFMYKFKNSNVLTKEAKSNLIEVEDELSSFRKKSLEREQKLRRKLQDEILKNRTS